VLGEQDVGFKEPECGTVGVQMCMCIATAVAAMLDFGYVVRNDFENFNFLLVLSGFCNTTIAEKFCHLYYLELPLGFGDAPRRSAHPQTSCPDTSHPRADSQLSMARI
jgi:hypothetical protein